MDGAGGGAAGQVLARLAAAFALPDDPPASSGPCPASLTLAPDVRFELADGRTMRASAPRDRCRQLLPEVTAALGPARTSPEERVVKVRRQSSEPALAAHCPTAYKDVLTGDTHGSGAGTMAAPPEPGARIGVCRYAARDGDLVLVASGTTTGVEVGPLRPRPASGGGCPARVTGAVLVHPLGGTGSRALVWVETGGCGRVVAGDGFGDVGRLPASEVTHLAALAGTPEPA